MTTSLIRSYASVAVLVVAGLLVGCDRQRPEANADPPASAEESKRERKEGAATAAPDHDDRYETVVSNAEIAAKREATIELKIEAGDGLKVNQEYPAWEFTAKEVHGIELDEKTFSRDDFRLSKGAAVAEATVRAGSPGEASIAGTANFSVCNDETCHILRDESIRFQFRVTESTGDDANEQPHTE